MPNCPNCGQPTSRTRDWACQWCGYPLVSKAYRSIAKTYKELQEERRPAERLPVGEEAGVPALEPGPTPRPEIEPVDKVEPEPVVEAELEPAVETEPEPAESKPKLRRRRKRVLKPKAAPEPEVEAVAEAELEPTPEPEPVLEAEPAEPKPKPRRRRKPGAESKPESAPEPETELVAEVEPETEAEAEPEPTPEPVAESETELASGLIEVGIEGLYSVFTADREAADARYKNKMIKVTGLLYRTVINENLDVAYIILTSAKKYGEWKVSCTFSKEREGELRRLTTQQMVTVQGKYDGYRVNVQMRDCVLVHGKAHR